MTAHRPPGGHFSTSIFDEPLVSFGPEITGDLAAALRREWLVTNGIGGYASGTLAGIPTRRYHGLLVAATEPPGGRRVLVGGLVEWAWASGVRVALHAMEYTDGTIDQHGYRKVQEFRLDGALPVWHFEVAGSVVERRIWMVAGENTTAVRYELLRGEPVDLEITPLLTDRDFHSLAFADAFHPMASAAGATVGIRMQPLGTAFRMHGTHGTFDRDETWFRGVRHREEAARGLDSLADLWAPGTFRARIGPGEPWTLMLSEADSPSPAWDADASLAEARWRQHRLLDAAGARVLPRAIQQLVLAADQFIVSRSAGGRTVIAGYHWFADWGRDTMIALSGLTLSTGRDGDARDILRTFAGQIRDGLLPNNLPETGSEPTAYNSVDGALWFIQALREYGTATGHATVVAELLPTVLQIADRYASGTRYGIHVDPQDGLLYAGEPGLQLTWMDARVGDREITPRIGKPVEINALWLNGLNAILGWLPSGHPERLRWQAALAQGRASFVERFWLPDRGYLADVIGGPDGDDTTLRPNQILALSRSLSLVDDARARSILDVVESRLLTTYGLRSLDPRDPAYHGAYGGDAAQRDGGYHEGPVWTWLIGPYADAVGRYRSREEALAILEPFAHHLADAGLGSISEILEGDPPHVPRGAIAQAWGVAEVLRVWRRLVEPAGQGG